MSSPNRSSQTSPLGTWFPSETETLTKCETLSVTTTPAHTPPPCNKRPVELTAVMITKEEECAKPEPECKPKCPPKDPCKKGMGSTLGMLIIGFIVIFAIVLAMLIFFRPCFVLKKHHGHKSGHCSHNKPHHECELHKDEHQNTDTDGHNRSSSSSSGEHHDGGHKKGGSYCAELDIGRLLLVTTGITLVVLLVIWGIKAASSRGKY